MSKHITTREEDYSQWYQDIIKGADLAEYGAARGSMIFKPTGWAIWEHMQKILDEKIKETGAQNVYFPLLIPKEFLAREADHVEGFAKECAVVTHYRLKNNPDGDGVVVDPDAKLEEEYVIRPTSETAIHEAFSRWISSYRDLPLMVNQWANVMRWEMRVRMFLRTAEFLWQEGHTAHATQEDAQEEVERMLEVYRWFAEEIMAIPVVLGEKSPSERFAGADRTLTIEAMMQDGKALQAGTSHNLGQNFSKAFNVTFASKENKEEYAWLTSWGVSTRLIGALIMSHSDDNGLVLPPRLAPTQVVIIPFIKEGDETVMNAVEEMKTQFAAAGVRVHVDMRDHLRMGEKLFEWEKKGVPVRIEIGPRDVENGVTMVARRDMPGKENKMEIQLSEVVEKVTSLLEEMHTTLLGAARERLEQNTYTVDSYDEFKEKIENGGFYMMYWCGNEKCEDQVKEETKATIRCIPFDQGKEEGACIVCGGASSERAIFARAY